MADVLSRLEFDETGFAAQVAALPDRLARIAQLDVTADTLPRHENIANVVILGIGDAGLDGALVEAVAGQLSPVPIAVHSGYDLPSYVDADTLVIAASAGGSADETITTLDDAYRAGAAIYVVSGPGALAERAAEWDVPHLVLDGEVVGTRALPGVVAVPILLALDATGQYPGARTWVDAAIAQLRIRRSELCGDKSGAATLARRIGRTMPLIYGGGEIGGVAARWWKSACNQSAKIAAFANVVPELCHDELAGFGQGGDVTRQVFTLVLVRHDHEHPQTVERFARLPDLLSEVVSRIEEVEAKGDGALAQLLDLAYVGQYVGLELAAIAGVDPGPVPIIDELAAAIVS